MLLLLVSLVTIGFVHVAVLIAIFSSHEEQKEVGLSAG